MNVFSLNELMASVKNETGLSDFGPDDFVEPLEVFLTDVNGPAAIAPDRRDRMEQRLKRLLTNRVWMAKDIAEHPEILDEDVGAPIFISTLPRTGSTKLHRLLAASGDFRALTFWHVHMPSRIPDTNNGGVEQRIAATREHEAWMYETSPAIKTGHPQYTDEAEEDQWLMEQSFRYPIFAGLFNAPSYMEWLSQADLTPAFDYFLTQLKYLQWQFPEDRGKRWLLKSPTHFGMEPLLQQTFGTMSAIVTHRDPGRVVPSITSTSMAARKMYSDEDSAGGAIELLTHMFSTVSNGHIAWREANTQTPILDLSFKEVAKDGVGAAARIYEFLQMELSTHARERMGAWESENTLEKHGQAKYSAAEFGVNEEEIRQAFKPYIQKFESYLN